MVTAAPFVPSASSDSRSSEAGGGRRTMSTIIGGGRPAAAKEPERTRATVVPCDSRIPPARFPADVPYRTVRTNVRYRGVRAITIRRDATAAHNPYKSVREGILTLIKPRFAARIGVRLYLSIARQLVKIAD